jgi:hypothetical protein
MTNQPDHLRAMHDFITDLSFQPVGATITINEDTHRKLIVIENYLRLKMFEHSGTAPIHREHFEQAFQRAYPQK